MKGGQSASQVILFVAVPRPMGGSNRSLATMLRALPDFTHRVVACPPDGTFLQYLRSHDLLEEHLPLPTGRRAHRLLAGLLLARWVWQRRRSLTAIHAQGLNALNLVSLASLLTGVRLVARITDPESSRWGRFLGPIIRRILRNVVWAPVSHEALAVAVANHLCSPEGVVIIPQPVDPADVLALNRIPPDDGQLRVGYLGGVGLRKGFDLLPDIVEATIDLPLTWNLFVPFKLGTEVDDAVHRLRAFDHVHFEGRELEVRNAYERIDIVLMPSRAESFGRIVVESMINGLPVVAADLPSVRLITEGDCAILVPPGDASAAAAGLRRLVNDPELREALARAGRKRAEIYSPEAIMDRFIPFYHESSMKGK